MDLIIIKRSSMSAYSFISSNIFRFNFFLLENIVINKLLIEIL